MGCGQFLVPCIFGYVQIKKLSLENKSRLDFVIVSRKEADRAGRRFITRGLDERGKAANFVETEHVLVLHQENQNKMKVSSYV